MQLIIEVPDDSPLAKEIESWEDGMAYELGVTQTGTGAFTLDSAEAAEADEQNNEGDEVAPDAPKPKYSNPAIAAMVGKKSGK